ncbi:MAG: ABC transporter substrate-binding protein, partial [Dehalococcoidia bacterium]|nr:ABC transporter substrate-binding protein [Dehalococcoidia bacterium]
IPFVTMATPLALTRDNRPGAAMVFRLGPSDETLTRALVEFVPQRLGSTRVALVAGDEAGATFAATLAVRWWQEAGEVVFGDSLPAEVTDFATPARLILAARPHAVVYAGGVETGAPLYAEIRRLGPGVPFVALPSAANPQFARLSGSPTDFAYLLTLAPDPADVQLNRSFVERYRAVWATDPSALATLTADGVRAVLNAVAHAIALHRRPSREAVAAGLRAPFEGVGLTGPLQFQSDGERPGVQPALYRMIGPRFPGEWQRA